ncbi:MAG: hypothetical protein KAS32_11130 [Candidatus Peribacteraceae bacterium]|nr:hypothetical protein [Candidatus Peribacteraceae bacterium]
MWSTIFVILGVVFFAMIVLAGASGAQRENETNWSRDIAYKLAKGEPLVKKELEWYNDNREQILSFKNEYVELTKETDKIENRSERQLGKK